MTALPRVLLLASEQHGAVAVRQMREQGLSWSAQRAAVATGVLQMVHGHVAVAAGSPDSWHRKLHVGQLALGPRAWVSRGRHHSLDGVRVHTTMHVGPHDVITVDGLRCSSATRTIIDLAALRVPQVRLAAAIDSAIRRRLSAHSVIAERLARLRGRGRHGVTAIDRLLPDTGGESPLERAFLRLMRQHRLPRPTTQHRVHGPNGLVGRVDFVYSDLRVVVEVTGRRGHASDAERQRDAQRRNELIDEGFRVYEDTRSDLEDRADWVAETMRSRLCAARSRRDAIGRHTDDATEARLSGC